MRGASPSLLLIISGSIAAYKSLELIRLWKQTGGSIRCILTSQAEQFITPLSVAALSQEAVYQDLFSLKDESEMGHIRLSREADLVVVAPASANLIAKMAGGYCGDLATAVLLASDTPVLVAPAMNPHMWHHPATQANLATLRARGIRVIEPELGSMACQENGLGRMPEPSSILHQIQQLLHSRVSDLRASMLEGKRALVTAGSTREPIDLLRYITNRSSGRQGYAIARALAEAGAKTTLISGPSDLIAPPKVELVVIETAQQLLEACRKFLPVEIAVCAAAVVDWRPAKPLEFKLKKQSARPPVLDLVENPDTLAELARAGPLRPRLLIGFAAESENIILNAQLKRTSKGCDWIVANDISPTSGVLGGRDNTVHLLREDQIESWPRLGKDIVAQRLAEAIASHFNAKHLSSPSGSSEAQTDQDS